MFVYPNMGTRLAIACLDEHLCDEHVVKQAMQ